MLPKSPNNEPQWPPRSPHEALLSTPRGRARLRAQQTSPSPLRSRPSNVFDSQETIADEQEDDDEEEEDEETLQLKLLEIQAKLRLKKLQSKKPATPKPDAPPRRGSVADLPRRGSVTEVPRRGSVADIPRRGSVAEIPRRGSLVEVPASPVQRARQTAAQQSTAAGLAAQQAPPKPMPKSPRRILLGIDKGLRGQDVSLKRAPTLRRPLSFNERLAAARGQETAQQEKKERIQNIRSDAFTVSRDEMEDFRAHAVDLPAAPEITPQYSREDIIGRSSAKQDDKKEKAAAAKKDDASFEPYSGFHLSRRILPHSVVARAVSGKTTYMLEDLLREVKAPNFELPEVETDVVVLAIVAEKSDPRTHKMPPAKKTHDEDGTGKSANNRPPGKYMVVTLVDLKHQVELFLFRGGFERYWKMTPGTVVAILNPVVMPPPAGRVDTGRWGLVINSDADTILEIGIARDLGYCQAVKRDGNLCSAWVNAKRTQFCEFHTNEAVRRTRSMRNDINGSSGLGNGGGRGGRGGWGGRGGRGGGGENNRWSQGGGRGNTDGQRGVGIDWDTRSQYFMTGGTSGGMSASALLDGDGFADRAERKEGIQRRLAVKERESDIARKLGELGSGAGRDYMQLRGRSATVSSGSVVTSEMTTSTATTATTAATATTATSSATDQAAASRASLLESLRMSGRGISRAGTPAILLGPEKRKRPQSSSSVSATSQSSLPTRFSQSTSGFGWGSNLRNKLGRMKEGEKLAPASESRETREARNSKTTPERSPVRKKTRFLLGGKGIREAGRESLGPELVLEEDEGEDELIII